MERKSILLLLFLVVAANAGPLNVRKKAICAQSCNPPTVPKFGFKPGRAYTFDYTSNTLTSLTGESKQSSGLEIKGKATLEVLSPCEMVLTLKDVKLFELDPQDGKTLVVSPRSYDFKTALEENDLHFSFNDGAINNLCPDKDEKKWVLNVKRGVLSMIQNTMTSLDAKQDSAEVDVAGVCRTGYRRVGDTIHRTKDLLSCSGREHKRSHIHSVPYFVDSKMQGTPLTKSVHVCRQTMADNNIYSKIECEEEHRLHKISRGSGQAKTNVKQKLTFVKEAESQRRTHIHAHRRTDLTFEFEPKSAQTGNEFKEARDFLREICARLRNDIRPQTPRFFTELIYRLRRLNEKDLERIYILADQRKACRTNNNIIRRLVVDAIPMLGNEQSMTIMKNMIIEGRLSDTEANLWLTSLAFIQNPSHDMLQRLHPLITEKKPRTQAMLGLSAMVYQYCKGRTECHAEPAIQAIGRGLRKIINGDCTTTKPEERTKILLALKAIGNAGVMSAVAPDLTRCILEEKNPMAVRIAAAEAFRRMDCSVNRNGLLHIYKNIEIDSELRINAYLALMTCPKKSTIDNVRRQLVNERVNQVGSFVWTHLTNLVEGVDPFTQHIKTIINDRQLRQEFKLDKLKFSRNIEKSLFSKKMNLGGRMESNVIWSQKSFLPRSVSLNLTTHLFGQSYNFLEFNGRVEGLETVFERYFGPDGYFKQKADNATEKKNDVNKKDFQFMDNKFKLQNDKLRAALGFKVFGHDVAYFDIINPDRKPVEGFNFLNMLIKLANEQEIDWSKHLMFLDSTITIPTVSGLPLELSINGTSSVTIKAKGKLDIRRLVSWPTTFDIDGTIQPSGSIEISAMMGVDAYYSRHGFKMVSNVHTSTQLDAKLKAKDSETFDVEFGMPREKQEIVNLDTRFFVVHRDTEREHSLPSIRRFDRKFCTGKKLARATGAELCIDIQSPAISDIQEAMLMPISGPLSASLALYRRDTHSSYKLAAKWQRLKHRVNGRNIYSRFLRFEVDTPKSSTPRRHLLDFTLNQDTRSVSFHLENPQGRVGFNGAFTNKQNHKELKLKFFKGKDTYFYVNLANQIMRKGEEEWAMRPTLKLKIPGVPHISLDSVITKKPNGCDFSVSLRNLLRGPLIIKGATSFKRMSDGEIMYVSNFNMNSHFFAGSIWNQVRRGNKRFISATKAKYGRSLAKQHSLEHKYLFKDLSSLKTTIYSIKTYQQMSQFPSLRTTSSIAVQINRESFYMKKEIGYGANLKKRTTLQLNLTAANGNGKTEFDLKGYFKMRHLDFPSRVVHQSWKGNVILQHQQSENSLITKSVTINAEYRPRPRRPLIKLAYFGRIKRPMGLWKIESNLGISLSKRHQVNWAMEVNRYKPGVYGLKTKADYNGQKMTADGNLILLSKFHPILNSTLRIGQNQVIDIYADTKISPRHPAIKWSVSRNEKLYAVKANYDFSGENVDNFGFLFKSEMECPYRKVKASGEFRRKPGWNTHGKLETGWDVGRDESRKMSILLRLFKPVKSAHVIIAKFEHPIRNINFKADYKQETALSGMFDAQLEYAPRKVIRTQFTYDIDNGWTQKGLVASITVSTPFSGFERTHLGINLLGQLRYRRAEIQFMWGNRKRVVIVLTVSPQGGNNFSADLKIVTPIPRYSYMRFKMRHEVSGNTWEDRLMCEIGMKKTAVRIVGVNNGDYYANDVAMTVALTSPFDNFRDLQFTVTHKDDSNQYNSNIEFKWGTKKAVAASTSLYYKRNGIDVTTNGQIRVTTPFEDYEQNILYWDHVNSMSRIKSEFGLECGPKVKMGMTVNGLVKRPESDMIHMTGLVTLTVPYYGKIKVDFRHVHSPKTLQDRLTLNLPKYDMYQVDFYGNLEGQNIDGTIDISTPITSYRNIGATFNHKLRDSTNRVKAEIYCGNSKAALASIKAKLTQKKRLPNSPIYFSATLTNKIVRPMEIRLTHQHTLTSRRGKLQTFKGVSELTYEPGKAISVNSELRLGAVKKLKAHITTPFEAFRTFQVSFKHDGDSQKFTHDHTIIYNLYDLKTNIIVDDINKIIGETKVNFKGYHSLRFSHRKTGDRYDTTGIVTYDSTDNIELKSEVNLGEKLGALFQLTTPFEVIRKVEFKMGAEKDATKIGLNDKVTALLSGSYTYREKVLKMNGVFTMKGIENMKGTFQIKTPFDNVRDISIVMQHSKVGRQLETMLIGKSENGRIEINNIFQKLGTLKNKFSIKSTIPGFKSFSFGFDHTGSFPRMSHKHEIGFDIAGKTMKLNNKFVVYKTRLIDVEIKHRSNIQMIRKAGIRFTFDRQYSGGIETGFLLEWPQDKLEGRVAFVMSKKYTKMELKISTPFYYFKDLQGLYTLEYVKPTEFIKHKMVLLYKNGQKEYLLSNSLTVKTLNYIDAEFIIKTPLEILKVFNARYKHKILKREKSFSIYGNYNQKEYKLTGSYRKLPIHILELELKTPHKNFKNLKIRYELSYQDKLNWKYTSEVSHLETGTRVSESLELKAGKRKFELTHSMSMNSKVVHEINLNGNWENDKLYTGSLIFMHTRLPNNPKTGQMILAEVTVDIRKPIYIQANLRTPFNKFENQWFSVKFEQNEFLKTDKTMKAGNLVIKANALSKTGIFQLRYDYGKRPSLQISVKIPDMQEIKLDSSLVMSESNKYAKMSVSAPDFLPKPWNLMVDVATTKTITISFKLDTTLEKYETISGRASVSKRPKYLKVNGQFSMPIMRKPIEFEIEGDLTTGVSLLTDLRGPYIRVLRSGLKFTGDRKQFDFSSELFTAYLNEPFATALKFNSKNGFKVESTITSPVDYLKRLTMETQVSISEKRGYIEINHNKMNGPIRAEGKVDYSQNKYSKNCFFDGNFFVKAPFKGAEETKVTLYLKRDNFKVDSKFSVTNSAMKGTVVGNLQFNFVKPRIEVTTSLKTPFDIMKDTSLNIVLLAQRDVNGRLTLTHNKIPGTISGRIDLKWPKSFELELTTPYDGWYKQMQLSTAITTGKIYKASASLRYYPAQVINANFETEINMPRVFINYRLNTPFEVIQQTYGSIEMKLQKQFLLNGEAYHNKMKEKISLNIQVNDAETKALTIQVKTPFDGPWKQFGAELLFSRKAGVFAVMKSLSMPAQFSGSAKFYYNLNREINFVTSMDLTSLKKFEMNVGLSTPFEIMEKSKLVIKWDLTDNINIVGSVAHNKLSSDLSTSLVIDKKTKKFQFRLNTPFNGPHKKISADGSITKTGDKYVVKATMEYYLAKQFSLETQVKPDMKDFSLTFNIKTPYDIMKETSGSITCNPGSRPMIRFEISHNKLSSKITGRIHVKPFARLRIAIDTPFDGPAKSILFDYSFKRKANTQKVSLLLKYSPMKVMKADVVYEKIGQKEMKCTVEMESPFDVMKTMTGTFTAKWDKKVESTLKLFHNKLKGNINVEVSYERNSPLKARASITTPFKRLESLTAAVDYTKEKDTHKASVTATYNKAKTIKADGSLKLTEKEKEFSLNLATPFDGIWKSSSVMLRYTKGASTHAVYAKAYSSMKTIEMNFNTNTDIKNLSVDFSIKTPFKVMKVCQTKFSWTLTPSNHFNAKLEFYHPKLLKNKPLNINADGVYEESGKDLKVTITAMDKTYSGKIYLITIGNRYKLGYSIVTDEPTRPWFLDVESTIRSINDWHIKLTKTSPQHRMDSGKPGLIKINMIHKYDGRIFENSFDLTSPYKKDIKYTGSLNKDKKNAKLEVEAKIGQFEKLTFEHEGNFNEFLSRAVVNLKNKLPIQYLANAKIQKPNVNIQIKLITPFSKWEETNFVFSHVVKSTPFKIALFNSPSYSKTRLEIASRSFGKFSINNDMKLSENLLENTFELSDTFRLFGKPTTLKTIVKVSPLKAKETSATVEISSSALKEKVDASISWKLTSDSFKAKLTSNAVINVLKTTIEFDASKMSPEASTASLTISSKALRESIVGKVDWVKTDKSFKGSLETKLPVKYLKSKITVNIPKMKKTESEASVTMTSTDVKEPLTVGISWNKGSSSFDGSIETKLPVKYLNSKITVNIPKMKKTESEASITVTSTDVKEPLTVGISWNKESSSFDGSIKTKLPVKYLNSEMTIKIPKMRIDESEASWTVTSTDLKQPVSIKIDWKRVSPTWRTTSSSFDCNIDVNFPIEVLQSKLKISIPRMKAKDTSASVTITSKRLKKPVSCSVTWKKETTSFESSIETDFPVKYMKSKLTVRIPKMMTKESDASITIESDGLKEPAKIFVNWKKTDSSFVSNVGVQAPVKYMKSKLSLKIDPMTKSSTNLQMTLESDDLKKSITTQLSWKKSYKGFETAFSLNSPFDYIKEIKTEFSYLGDSTSFKSNLLLYANKLGTALYNLDYSDLSTLRFTRGREMKFDAKIIDNMQPSGSYYYRRPPKTIFTITAKSSASDIEMVINMPTNPKVKAITYKGTATSTTRSYTLTWDSNKVSTELTLLDEKYAAVITTTFPGYERMSGEVFVSKACCDDIKYSVKVTHPKGEFSAAMTWNMKSDYILTSDIKNTLIPKVPDVSLYMKHSGKTIRQFKNILKVNINNKKASTEISFDSISANKEGMIRITTPYQKYERMQLSYKLIGDKSNFQFNAGLITSFISTGIELKCANEAKPSDRNLIDIAVNFNKKTYNMKITYEGEPKYFTGTMRIDGSENRVKRAVANKPYVDLSVTSRLEYDSYEGTIEVKSEYLPEDYKKMSGKIKAEGDFRTGKFFSFDSSFTTGKGTYFGKLKWDSLRMKGASASIGFPSLVSKCIHSGEALFEYSDKEIVASTSILKCNDKLFGLDFKTDYALSTLELITPMKDLNTKLTVKHIEIRTGYNVKVTFDNNKLGTYKFDGTFKADRYLYSYSAKIVFTMPNNKITEFNVMSIGNPKKKLSISGDLKLPNSDVTKAKFEYSIEKLITVNLNLETPFKLMKTLDINFKHESSYKKFQTELTFEQNKLGKYSTFLSYDGTRSAYIVFTLNTPHEILKEVEFKFSYAGQITKQFTQGMSGTWNGKTMAYTAAINIPALLYRIEIDTPFKGFEKIVISNEHEGDSKKFSHAVDFKYGNNKAMRFELKHDYNDNDYTGNVRFTSPYENFKDISLSLYHKKKGNSEWEMNHQLTYAPGKTIRAIGFLNHGLPKLSAMLSISTPFQQVPSIEINLKHNHRNHFDFDFIHTLKVDEQEGMVNGDFKLTPDKTTGSLNINTPFERAKNIEFNFVQRGYHWRKLDALTSLTYGANVIELNGDFDATKPSEVSGSVTLKTPWQLLKTSKLTFTHKGGLLNHFQTVNVEVNDKIFVYNGMADLTDPQNMMAEHTLTTPFNKLKSLKIEFNHKAGIAHFTVRWNKDNFVKAVGIFKRGTIFISQLTITSSLPSLKNGVIRLKHRGPISDFATETSIDINGKQAVMGVNFKQNLEDIGLMAQFPEGSLYNFHIGVQKEEEDTYVGKMRVAKGNKDLISLMSRTKFNLATPQKKFDLELVLALPILQNVNSALKVSFEGSKELFVIDSSANIYGNIPQNLKHNLEFKMNCQNQRTIVASLKHNGTPYTFKFIPGPSDIENARNMAIVIGYGKRNIGLSLDYGPEDFELDLHTPYRVAKKIHMKFHLKLGSKFVHKSSFSLNDHRYYEFALDAENQNGATKAANSMSYVRYFLADLKIRPDRSDSKKDLAIAGMCKVVRNEGYDTRMRFSIDSDYRSFTFDTKNLWDAIRITHETAIYPRNKEDTPWKFSFQTNFDPEDPEETTELILTTPVRELKLDFERAILNDGEVYKNKMQFYWDHARDTNKKMGWKMDLKDTGKQYKGDIKLFHPMISDVVLKTDTTLNSRMTVIRSSTRLSYSKNPSEAMEFNLKISRDQQKNVLRGKMSLSQEATGLLTILDGSFGGYGGVYINSLDLRHKMNNKIRTFKIMSHINMKEGSQLLELMTPDGQYEWNSKITDTKEAIKFEYRVAFNKLKKYTGEVIISESPSFKCRHFFTPGKDDNYVEAIGSFVNKKQVEVQVFRMLKNKRTSDFLFNLQLRGEHLLKTRIFWRPTFLQGTKTYLDMRMYQIKSYWKTVWPRFAKAARQEMMLKKNLIIATIPNFKILSKFSDDELTLVKEDLFKLRMGLTDLYNNNEFYLKDISEFMDEYLKKIGNEAKVMAAASYEDAFGKNSYIARSLDSLRQVYNEFRRKYARFTYQIRRTIPTTFSNFYQLRTMSEDHVTLLVNKVTSRVRTMHLRYTELEKRLCKYASALPGAARYHYYRILHPRVLKVHSWTTKALKDLSKYHRGSRSSILNHFDKNLEASLTKMHMAIQMKIDNLAHRYGLLFNNLRTRLDRQLNDTIDSSFASSIIRVSIEKIQWVYDHFDLEDTLKVYGRRKYLELFNYLKGSGIDFIGNLLHFEKQQLITFEPQNGRIEAQVYVPFVMHDLVSRPVFSGFPTMRKRQQVAKDMSTRYRLPRWIDIKHEIMKYMPNLEKNPRAWIPTFRGYASISGKHIITFDKVHYDLDGNCDYVLARDYKAKRWTVLLNQANNKRYISFRVYNKIFAIYNDHSVTVNGLKVELPFVYRNLSILRFGPIIKATDNLLGFSVTSDVINNLHTIGVTGWYHGKLGGLFGNFDNEQYNDFQTVDHRLATNYNVNFFIQSWSIRGCEHKNKVFGHRRPNRIANKVCNFMFGCPLSPLAKCFRHVDPEPFRKICLDDVDSPREESKNNACYAARLYVYHCKMAHVSVRVPRPCRRCSVPGKAPIHENKFVTLENKKAMADVVFVVEEAPCNKDVVPRLNEIVRRMERAFSRRGMTDNRYGLIGFGRKVHGIGCTKGHTHTVSSQLLGESKHFMRALSTFELETYDNETSRNIDPLRAIRKATRYPFRPGSARTVVVVPCNACQESRLRIADVEKALKDQDISLHVLLDHQIRVRRPSRAPQSNFLFGLDGRAVFTQRDVQKLRGDTKLVGHVVRPKDMCSQLAYSTKGAIFNSRKLTRMHVSSQTWFAQVFANRVADYSKSPTVVECKCTMSRWDQSHLSCRRKDKTSIQVPGRKPYPVFTGPQQSYQVEELKFRR